MGKNIKLNKNAITSQSVKKKIEKDSKLRDMEIAHLKLIYVSNYVKGNYFFAICNKLAKMIKTETFIGDSMGIPRDEELAKAEYTLHKKSAIDLHREAFFAKKTLMEEYKISKEEIEEKLNDYINGKIIREEYNAEDRRPGAKRFFG